MRVICIHMPPRCVRSISVLNVMTVNGKIQVRSVHAEKTPFLKMSERMPKSKKTKRKVHICTFPVKMIDAFHSASLMFRGPCDYYCLYFSLIEGRANAYWFGSKFRRWSYAQFWLLLYKGDKYFDWTVFTDYGTASFLLWSNIPSGHRIFPIGGPGRTFTVILVCPAWQNLFFSAKT